MHPNLYTGGMNDNPVPDLDTDTLTYKFSKAGSKAFRTVYNIERSINGDSFHIIGTVIKTRDSDWSSPARWEATALDGTGASRDSRKAAVQALEHRLQGPEYAERKRAEWVAQREAAVARQTAAEAKAAERVKIFDRSTWNEPSVVVTMDDFAVAQFYIGRLSAEMAMNAATDLADHLRRDIVSEVLA